MKFKVGDIVIKKTGGNKMTIQNCLPGNTIYVLLYRCYWFIESSLNQELFSENDIVSIEEYKIYLKIEEREDKINKILSNET